MIEVLISVAILSSAIIFIFRAFTAALSAAKTSQNIAIAVNLAENKYCAEIELKQKLGLEIPASGFGTETIQSRDFAWKYDLVESADPGSQGLKELKFNVAWTENIRQEPYSLELQTYAY